ncbi:MAG TPA: group 1 truncated hemoglobin [Burkholderiaceae bacterium]
MAATLFERLGGEDGIARLVTDILDLHYRNPLICSRFEKIKDRAAVERHSVEFVCAGSGGPQAYTGRDMLSVHKGMNISEQELVAAIDDFVQAMTKNHLDQSVQNEVIAILYSLKGDVVRR